MYTFCSVSFWRRWRSISASRSTSSILRLRTIFRCFDDACTEASLLLLDVIDTERFLHIHGVCVCVRASGVGRHKKMCALVNTYVKAKYIVFGSYLDLTELLCSRSRSLLLSRSRCFVARDGDRRRLRSRSRSLDFLRCLLLCFLGVRLLERERPIAMLRVVG